MKRMYNSRNKYEIELKIITFILQLQTSERQKLFVTIYSTYGRWWRKSIFHQEDKIVAGCSVHFTWFFNRENTRRKTKADSECADLAFRNHRVQSRESGTFLLFFLFLPLSLCVRHPRQDYLILALIAERTKREWPYLATIAIVVHDLRVAVLILLRSRILTYC